MFKHAYLCVCTGTYMSRGSSGSTVSDYGLNDRGSIPDRGRRFFFLVSASRSALGLTQPPIQWVPGVLSPGIKRGRGVTLTTHPHLVPRLSMSRSYTSSPPHVPPWRVAGHPYFTFFTLPVCVSMLINTVLAEPTTSNPVTGHDAEPV
jgi:hypothetical protein